MNLSQLQSTINSTSNVTETLQALDKVKVTPTAIPVLTARGVRIPLVGTIAYHEAIGFCTVTSRTQSSLSLSVDDVAGAHDVTLRDGSIVSRADWLQRVSDVSLNSACIEIAGLEARLADREDALHGATSFVKELCSSLEARVRDAEEMVIAINGAERCGWQFDEYASYIPQVKSMFKSERKAFVEAPARVVTDDVSSDDPDWLVAELDDCDWSGDRA